MAKQKPKISKDYCFRRHSTYTDSQKTELKSRNNFFLGPMEFKLKNTNPKLEVTCDASISQKKDIMCTNMCRLQGVSVSVYPCVSGISCKSFYISRPTMCQTLWKCGSTQNNRISPQTDDKVFWFSRNSLQNTSIQPA